MAGDTSVRTDRAVKVFISYAHEDEALRESLEKHLDLLRRQGHIDLWNDRQIRPGAEWAQEIDDQLEAAELILLLISAEFLASDYCYGMEMARSMERYHAGEATIVPIILRHVDWTDAPFDKLQMLPRDARPITDFDDPDEAFSQVAGGLRETILHIKSQPVKPPPQPPGAGDGKFDVFVTYGDDSKRWVREQLVPRLLELGVNVGIDYRSYRIGVDLQENFRRVLWNSRCSLAVLTPQWLETKWPRHRQELLHAEQSTSSHRLLPLLRDDCEIPEELSNRVLANFVREPFEDEVQRLVRTIQSAPLAQQPRIPEITDSVGMVVAGLQSLCGLLDAHASLLTAVRNRRARITPTRESIFRLGDYKRMHALLHDLESNHRVLAGQANQPPGASVDWDLVEKHLEDVERVSSVLQTIRSVELAQDAEARSFLDDALNELDSARQLGETALDSEDIRQLGATVWKIQRAFATDQSFISKRMKQLADALDLQELRTMLDEVLTEQQALAASDGAWSQFEVGVHALGALSDELQEQTDRHDAWQRLDTTIRMVGTNLEKRQVQVCVWSWQDVKQQTEALCRSSSERWAKSCMRRLGKLEDAINHAEEALSEGRDEASLTEDLMDQFEPFRSYAFQRFVIADQEVLNQYSKLNKIAAPIQCILEKVQ